MRIMSGDVKAGQTTSAKNTVVPNQTAALVIPATLRKKDTARKIEKKGQSAKLRLNPRSGLFTLALPASEKRVPQWNHGIGRHLTGGAM